MTKTNRKATATVTVTADGFGTRTMTWHGPTAAKTAAYWAGVWRAAGHTVVES